MFHTPRKALGTALATALTLAATAAPGALAQPINPRSSDASEAANGTQPATDVRSPDARDAADRSQPPPDLRSPDARDAAAGRQIAVAGPPTWPTSPQPVTPPRVVVSAPDSGLDWPSAGIGAGTVIGALAIALVGTVGLRRRRIARPGSLTPP
ncbi:MAG TPA: hypothetical protein VF024_19815 [Solirubrobacteraceae bacterium]